MKYLSILALFCLAACSKTIDMPAEPATVANQPGEFETCKFGMTQFNMVKRPAVADGEAMRGKPVRLTSGGGSSTTGGSVILLDFDGQKISGTSWNWNGDIIAAPANLTAAQIEEIFQRVANDYSPFNITVTTDEAVYSAANVSKRTRVVITESWEWFGQSGGVAYVNSFTWGNDTPCFVFSSLLNYGTKYIAEAASHEAGHTIGLYHQSLYDASGVKISEYNKGQGTGETGWAPIMGVGYYQNLTLWHNGPNSNGATSYQDDVAIIKNAVSVKTDDYTNSPSGAASLVTSLDGVINNNTDADFFSVDISSSKTISVVPFNLGVNNSGANLDLVLKIYNSQGALIATIDDASILSETTTLNAGKYYISVNTTANQYADKYGMIGRYSINVL